MNFKDEEELLPRAKGGSKKNQLKKDERLKNFWEGIAEEWLRFRSRKSKDEKGED